MKTLGIIPARAGSKRLPGKNLAEIGGKSLVRIAVECGLDAGLDMVVVSTDSAEIWGAAMANGFSDPRLKNRERPEALARDEARSIDVVTDVLGAIHPDYGPFDVLVLLQPTSPLRIAADVRGCLALMDETGAEAIVSVCEATKADWLFEIGHTGRLAQAGLGRGKYQPNGAVFVLTTEAMRQGFDWWPPTISYAYLMPTVRSVDIDTAADLAMARAIAADQAEVQA